MKKKFTISILISFSFLFNLSAQYTATSPYLINPALAIGYADSCARFWLQTWDSNSGGFYTNIDKFGNVISSWGTNKNMLTQSRNAYGLTRAFMLTGDTTFLGYAQRALGWMYEHAWDNNYGGWFQELNSGGNPINQNGDKTAFYQHYALLGIAAYYEATHDTTAWNWLMKGYEHLENYYWDNRPSFSGYYDRTNYDNTNPHNKSFNATVDAITTHLLYLYLMTKDEKYKTKLIEIAEEIKQHLTGSMPQQAIGFVESFDSNWNWNNSETMTIMGHVLKSGWCLGRVNQLFPDTHYIDAAEFMIADVLLKGYDHDFGGPYKDFNRVTGQMLLWDLQDSTKAWWQMEQSIVAGLELYEITGDSKYLQMADETTNFYMQYFVDHINGEVYADRTRYGGFAWNEAKGNSGKSGYHSIETGYYIYLYGNLFYKQQAVMLNYNFGPLPFDREIFLTPLSIGEDALKIAEAKLDGQLYTNYNSVTRTLQLPAGIGGHFEITFEPTITNVIAAENLLLDDFILFQNYPNPFNPLTKIKFTIPASTFKTNKEEGIAVLIRVYDVLGREVKTLLNEVLRSGEHEITFDGKDLSSGIYFCVFHSGGLTKTTKMNLLK
jgi:mannose/cellobiose epimerase-like protein (N-acyl-D-glucosamine 2-epimerase family)